MKVNSQLHNRDYYLPLPQQVEVSFLYSLAFNSATHSYAKLKTRYPTLSLKTAGSLPSSYSVSRAASLIHTVPGTSTNRLLREGCSIRLYFKAKQKKTPGLTPFNAPWVCNLPLQSFGGYIFLFVRRAPSNLPLPLFRREGEGEDSFLELCAGLKTYLNSPTGKWSPGTDPQHIRVTSLKSSCGTSA